MNASDPKDCRLSDDFVFRAAQSFVDYAKSELLGPQTLSSAQIDVAASRDSSETLSSLRHTLNGSFESRTTARVAQSCASGLSAEDVTGKQAKARWQFFREALIEHSPEVNTAVLRAERLLLVQSPDRGTDWSAFSRLAAETQTDSRNKTLSGVTALLREFISCRRKAGYSQPLRVAEAIVGDFDPDCLSNEISEACSANSCGYTFIHERSGACQSSLANGSTHECAVDLSQSFAAQGITAGASDCVILTSDLRTEAKLRPLISACSSILRSHGLFILAKPRPEDIFLRFILSLSEPKHFEFGSAPTNITLEWLRAVRAERFQFVFLTKGNSPEGQEIIVAERDAVAFSTKRRDDKQNSAAPLAVDPTGGDRTPIEERVLGHLRAAMAGVLTVAANDIDADAGLDE